MLHYQNVNEVSEATGDQTSEIPLTENHQGIRQNFMLPVRLPVIGLHGKKMPSFISDQMRRANDFINMCGHIHLVIFNTTCI